MTMPSVIRSTARWAWVLPAVLLHGCDSPAQPSDSTLTATPNPAFAEPSNGVFYTIPGDSDEEDEVREYPWKTSFTVTFTETAGVGLDITAVNLTVQQAAGGIVVPPPSGQVERHQFNLQAGTNRVDPFASATLAFEVFFELPNGNREALATASVSWRDDNDYTGTETTQVRIQ
jgi:hypothetical protein